MLQVVGQIAARQLDGAAVGAGYHIEGAGGEVALRETWQQREALDLHPPTCWAFSHAAAIKQQEVSGGEGTGNRRSV